MDQGLLINVLLPMILAFIMFSLGLTLKFENFQNIGKYPKAFTIGFINQLILLPLITFCIIKIFNPSNEIAFGMMLLSFCPGGVTSNMLCQLMRGNVALSVTLTSVMSLVSIITVPIMISVFYVYFLGTENSSVNIAVMGFKMFLIAAFPVFIGTLINNNAEEFSNRIRKGVMVVAWTLFFLLVIVAIASNKDMLMEQFGQIGAMISLMMLAMLAMGIITSKIFGLSFHDAKTIALETGIQNSTMGMALAGLVAATGVALPVYALPSALYSVIMYIIAVPFCLMFRGTGGDDEYTPAIID